MATPACNDASKQAPSTAGVPPSFIGKSAASCCASAAAAGLVTAMLKWLTALIASSFTFALADVLCDICSTRQSPHSARCILLDFPWRA